MDTDLILDVWGRLKPIIPQKVRLEAADALIAVFDDYGMADDLINEALDKELGAAVKSRFADAYDEDDEDDDEYS